MSVHLARGTRDFLPDQAARRHQVIDRLRQVFARHGFEPLETPAFERIETLTGKYGDEGQKLMFKILKRGEGSERGECDLALRYDLTVPLARVVAMNPGLRMPFKRWQAAPVWRAERPARGRFREFWQCDADIVGSTEPLADAQCIAVAVDALETLGFEHFTVKLNDRRLLRALAVEVGAGEAETAFLVALDKLDKIGRDGVDAELRERGLETPGLWETLEALERGTSDLAPEVRAELEGVIELAEALGVEKGRIRFDPTLARGLDYYTGPVFEVVVEEPKVGSIAGGGRYDGLVGVFGKTQVPAVGVALGLERVLLVMEELGMFGPREDLPQVVVTVYSTELRAASARIAGHLRAAGVRADLYVGGGSMKSQFKYANALGAPWVVVVGPSEAENGTLTLKDMRSGTQEQVTIEGAIAQLS